MTDQNAADQSDPSDRSDQNTDALLDDLPSTIDTDTFCSG